MHSLGHRIPIEISAGALILAAVLLLMLPIQWLVAALIAAITHELCHALMTIILGGKIESITIGGRGAVMKATALSSTKEMVACFAGPVGSLSLLLLARWMPRTAICGLIHGIYNLLPLFPLDGGRILRSLLYCVLTPPRANRVFAITQRFFIVGLSVLLCVIVGKMSFIMLIAVIAIIWLRRR